MQPNLYRIDDVLLRTGLIAGVFAVLVANACMNQFEASGFHGPALLALVAAIACPLTLLGAGYLVRRRERVIVDLWRLIEAHGEVPVPHLCRIPSFSRTRLTSAVRRINRHERGLLVWDETADVIRAGGRSDPVWAPMTWAAPTARPGNRLNLAVFIVLLVLFWPGAVIYALHRYQA